MTTKAALIPGQVTWIPVNKLLPDPDQPRKSFDDKSLQQLGASLKRRVEVPLLVRPGAGGKYIIHDGERRWRAAKLFKLKILPVLLVEASESEQDLRTQQLAVNNLREQLTTMEVARMLAELQRKHFASANELAAHIEHSGLPAMTPKQIKDIVALVDLPDWAQAMIDAGQVEASAAVKLRIAMPYPKVMANTQQQINRDVKWRGKVTASELISDLRSAFRNQAVDLSYTESWEAGSDRAVHFNPKTACKGCEHLVTIEGHKYCMNREEFELKNAEAKAAGLLPGGKKPAKVGADARKEASLSEIKEKKRTQTLGEKAREYLHGYLIQRLMRYMRTDIDITDELLAWHAMGRPGEDTYGRHPALPHYGATLEAKVHKLEDLIAISDLDRAKKCAAIELAHGLKWRETQVLCHELWGSAIELVWEIDYAFVNLFRKTELLFLAEQHHLTLEEGCAWQKLKASELKAEILKRADQVRRPAILQDLYETIAEP